MEQVQLARRSVA